MCFGKSSKRRELTPEEIKERDKNRGDLGDDTMANMSKGRSKSKVTGGTKNAPSRSSRPMARGQRPSLISRTISGISQAISPRG